MDDTRLYINIKNLANNLNFLKTLKSVKNKKIIAIIKSDAYGHGLLPVAEMLFKSKIDFFGIIEMEEAENILKKIPQVKLLMLKGVNLQDLKTAAELNLRIGVFSLDYLKELLNRTKSIAINKILNIHLKFDSGMNRLGLTEKDVEQAIPIINDNKQYFNVEGLFSHLSSAGNDTEYTKYQINNFKRITSMLEKNKIIPAYKHISASSSLLNCEMLEDYSNAVRPGISLYGFNPNTELNNSNGKETGNNIKLKQLMTLKSKVLQIKKVAKGGFVSYGNTFKADRDITIAIISAGYDNGIPRLLSNKGRVLINGKFAPIIGIITMNMTMVDISAIKGVKTGDETIITGRSGSREIKIEEIASLAQTIPYEICLNFGKSNKKVYAEDGPL